MTPYEPLTETLKVLQEFLPLNIKGQVQDIFSDLPSNSQNDIMS